MERLMKQKHESKKNRTTTTAANTPPTRLPRKGGKRKGHCCIYSCLGKYCFDVNSWKNQLCRNSDNTVKDLDMSGYSYHYYYQRRES